MEARKNIYLLLNLNMNSVNQNKKPQLNEPIKSKSIRSKLELLNFDETPNKNMDYFIVAL